MVVSSRPSSPPGVRDKELSQNPGQHAPYHFCHGLKVDLSYDPCNGLFFPARYFIYQISKPLIPLRTRFAGRRRCQLRG